MKRQKFLTYCTLPFIAAISLLLIAQKASADPMIPMASGQVVQAGIIVQGHADIKLKPDIAHISIGVTTQSLHVTDATRSNARKSASILQTLLSAGIDKQDIQTSGYDVEPQYDNRPSPPVLTGYEVDNTFDVTIRNLTKAGSVIDAVTQAGATNVSGITFDLADRTAAEQKALAQAVKEAGAKAVAMANAAGVGVGPLLSLNEGTPSVVRPLFMARAMVAMAPSDNAPTPVASGMITVSADVTAVYAISN